MPRKTLNSYNVHTLRTAIRLQNKAVKSGKVGDFLPQLHRKKRADLVKFIKKNYKLTNTRVGALRLKNKHVNHVMQNVVRRRGAAAPVAQPPLPPLPPLRLR